MQSPHWYVRVRGKIQGPFTLSQLGSLRDRSRLTSIDEVSPDRREWIVAGAVADLFPPHVVDTLPTIEPPPLPLTKRPEQGDWYYTVNGLEMGPVSFMALQQLAIAGGIGDRALVRQSECSAWKPADVVPGLHCRLRSNRCGTWALAKAVLAACIVLAVAGLAIGTVVYLENSQRKNDKRILAQSNVIERLDAELKKVEQKSKKEIEEVMNRVEVQRQQQKSAKTNNTQEDENPPVTGPGAYVQTFDCDYVSEGSGILDGFYYDIKAQVKIVRSGTYTVRAGFWKNNKFLVGEISGGNYFRDRIVSGETGDMIPVAIRIANIRPLFCRTMNCQVVDQ